jgi:hypothetical protein
MLPVSMMKTPVFRPVRLSGALVGKFAPGRRILLSFLGLLVLRAFCPAAPEESAFGATPEKGTSASVAGISGANAELNGERLTPGATLFRGDVITLGPDSSAALQFGKGLVLVGPGTELVVDSGRINLRSGRVQIRLGGTDTFVVSGPFFRVNVVPSGGSSGSAEILVGGKQAQVSAVAGIGLFLSSREPVSPQGPQERSHP